MLNFTPSISEILSASKRMDETEIKEFLDILNLANNEQKTAIVESVRQNPENAVLILKNYRAKKSAVTPQDWQEILQGEVAELSA